MLTVLEQNDTKDNYVVIVCIYVSYFFLCSSQLWFVPLTATTLCV